MPETPRLAAREVRAARPRRPTVDPWRAHGALVEDERLPGGERARTLTVFLAGAECPFTCVFCDLWRYTTPGPTPAGALPAQLRRTLEEHTLALDPALPCHLKLYNASNFFEPRAVPPEDDEALLELARPFDRVVVESHPRLLGERCRRWAEALGPGRLQVAMGLETIHPEAQPKLGKGATLADYEAAARFLAEHGVSWRAFVLVGAPYVASEETVEWTVRTTAFALEHGAEHVALIPLRPGNGALEQLAVSGDFRPPTLEALEHALDRCQELARRTGGEAVVTADTWDLETFAPCPECLEARSARLERLNLEGGPRDPIACSTCGAGSP